MNAAITELESTSRAGRAPLRPVVIWVVLLATLTVGAATVLDSSGGDYRDVSPAVLVIAYSPAVAAIAVSCFQRGPDGVRALLAQVLRWRTRPSWYAIALFGPLAFALATVGMLTVLGGARPAAPLLLPVGTTMLAVMGPVIAGSFGEELGWRGFAQVRLQTRWRPLRAAVVVGILWSAWHLWPALTPVGSAELNILDVVQTFLRLIATSIFYGWLYNASGQSLPVVLVAHAGNNIAVGLMPPAVIGTSAGALTFAGLHVLAAAAVLIATRGHLGQTAGRRRT